MRSISKFVGSMIGARLSGLATREGMALGTALNARGALAVIGAHTRSYMRGRSRKDAAVTLP